MDKRKSVTIAFMAAVDAACFTAAVVLGVLCRKFGYLQLKPLYVTFLTVAYHFTMRLIVGEAVSVRYKNRSFNLDSAGFRIHSFEPELYKFLRVREWKRNVITAKPGQFKADRNNMQPLLHNMAQAELVHRIIAALSFVPLLLIIPYGAPAVFIVTSLLACLTDLRYVIVQRYNRPRVIRLMRIAERKNAPASV